MLNTKKIGISFITNFIPRRNNLNTKLQIEDKYRKLTNTSLTVFQRLYKQSPFFSKFALYINSKENI